MENLCLHIKQLNLCKGFQCLTRLEGWINRAIWPQFSGARSLNGFLVKRKWFLHGKVFQGTRLDSTREKQKKELKIRHDYALTCWLKRSSTSFYIATRYGEIKLRSISLTLVHLPNNEWIRQMPKPHDLASIKILSVSLNTRGQSYRRHLPTSPANWLLIIYHENANRSGKGGDRECGWSSGASF